GSTCTAYAIDVHNRAVGSANVRPGGPARAFVWQDGTFRNLGVLPGGAWSAARAVNRRAHVVGSAEFAGTGHMHAFLWSGGSMKDIGTAPHFPDTEALAINDRGFVVGHGYDDEGRTEHALRFVAGRVAALEDEVDNLGDWTLAAAYGINDAGLIVGEGRRGG